MTNVEQDRLSPVMKQLKEAFVEKDILPVVGFGLVSQAFRHVDRRQFLPSSSQHLAYGDTIIPLDEKGSSVSQPTLVAIMINHLDLTGTEKVLEIGTGSGYETALLSCCAKKVYSVEHNEKLAAQASERLKTLGYANAEVLYGDGALGWSEKAPFDAIIVSAGVKEIPNALAEQLAENGRIVIPVVTPETNDYLNLVAGVKQSGKIETKVIDLVRFHPLVSPHHGGWTKEEVEIANGREETTPDDVKELEQLMDRVRQKIERGQLPEEERAEQLEYSRHLEAILNFGKKLLGGN